MQKILSLQSARPIQIEQTGRVWGCFAIPPLSPRRSCVGWYLQQNSSEVTPATEMGQLRQNFVLQSEAENEIYAGFLVSFSNQKPGMKFTPALFGFPFS